MKKNNLEYKYSLDTWGGFYNAQHIKIHGKKSGFYVFKTVGEREDYIKELIDIEKDMSAYELMIIRNEGYIVDVETILHRIIRYKNIEYYSNYNIGNNYPFTAAQYHMEYKWRPGFNDYPLGENFNYDDSGIEIVQEWITGAFDI